MDGWMDGRRYGAQCPTGAIMAFINRAAVLLLYETLYESMYTSCFRVFGLDALII